jgi:hypothetical protein
MSLLCGYIVVGYELVFKRPAAQVYSVDSHQRAGDTSGPSRWRTFPSAVIVTLIPLKQDLYVKLHR